MFLLFLWEFYTAYLIIFIPIFQFLQDSPLLPYSPTPCLPFSINLSSSLCAVHTLLYVWPSAELQSAFQGLHSLKIHYIHSHLKPQENLSVFSIRVPVFWDPTDWATKLWFQPSSASLAHISRILWLFHQTQLQWPQKLVVRFSHSNEPLPISS